ncbi:MAG: gas vesicle protein GvpFL [Pseudonocardiaceae bacterium]|nr:gas vesicle protein GvpFL [Pseudonocardiaceae bacterium]
MALHVYGVLRGGTPLPELPETAGVGDSPGEVWSVEYDDLAALVSEIADDYAPTDHDGARHLDVLARLIVETTVLPVRFGTVAPDEDAVRFEVLEPAAAELRSQLRALDGFVELRVDLTFDEQEALRGALAASPELRGLAGQADGDLEQRIGVGEIVTEGVAEWTRQQGEQVAAPLTRLARLSVPLNAGNTLVARLALLVARDRVTEMDEAVRQLRSQLSTVDVEYVGPLPPYDFLDAREPEAERTSRWGW